MSGGVAYILDVKGDFPTRCNMEMVTLEKLTQDKEIEEVRQMIERYLEFSGSARAEHLLSLWTDIVPKFVKVMPKDYKRVLDAMNRVQAQGLSGEEAIMAAFEENARDLSRVSGN